MREITLPKCYNSFLLRKISLALLTDMFFLCKGSKPYFDERGGGGGG